jgi:hypothetical protein
MKVCGRASNRRGQGRALAVDRTPDGDADNVEEATASERRLPRDDPGTEGSSSRADSRAGAAAANEAGSGQTEAKPREKGAELTGPSTGQSGGETTAEAAKRGTQESGEQARDTAAEDDEPRDIAVKASGKPLREHIDPVGAETGQQPPEGSKDPFERTVRDKDAPWTDGVDTFDDLPAGYKLAESDEDRTSKADRFRAKVYEKLDDIEDHSEKVTNAIDRVFGPRPPGHAEVRAANGPTVVDAHHADIDLGGAASTLLAVGIVGAEAVRKVHGKLKGQDG